MSSDVSVNGDYNLIAMRGAKIVVGGGKMSVNDDHEPTDRLAELVQKHFKPAAANTPLQALVRLAEIDAQRMKAIIELFALVLSGTVEETETRPPTAPRRRRRKRPGNVVAIDSNRGKSGGSAENGPKAAS
jgi:hypothetical protein